MRLRRIEITNYRRIRQLDVDFTGNLIGILGPMGSGKSTFLGAIQYALTGEDLSARERPTKEDLTTWGEDIGSVKLQFEANGESFDIVRKTDGSATLKVNGDTVTGVRKVEEALALRAGIEKDLVQRIVFVAQKGTEKILFDDPKGREVSFQKLIGIGEASKIWTDLGTIINALDKPQGFDEAIEVAKRNLDETEEVIRKSSDKIAQYKEVIGKLPGSEELEKIVGDATRRLQDVEALEEKRDALLKAQKALEAAQERLAASAVQPHEDEDSLREQLKTLTAQNPDEAARSAELRNTAKEIESRIAELKEAKRFVARLHTLVSDILAARKERDAAQKALDEYQSANGDAVKELTRELEDATGRCAALKAELDNLAKLAGATSDGGLCPLCGNKTTPEEMAAHVGGRIEELKVQCAAETARRDKTGRELDERSRGANDLNVALSQASANLKAREGLLERAKGQNVEGVVIDLEKLTASYKGWDVDSESRIDEAIGSKDSELAECNEAIGELEAAEAKRRERVVQITDRLEAARKAALAVKEVKEQIANAAARLDVAKSEELKAMEKVHAMPGQDMDALFASASAAVAKAQANRKAYEDILKDVATEEGRLDASRNAAQSIREKIADLEAKKAVDDAKRSRIDTLTRVRDAFHFRKIPRQFSQQVMAALTADVNGYLEQFNSPFCVEQDEEGFGFRYRYVDGRPVSDPLPSAAKLSGGEGVTLAIAFRLAIYRMYGGKLGLLSLDEPTDSLDEDAIQSLGDLLQKVKEFAKNSGLQILMATHERRILSYFDTQIAFGKKGEI